MPLPTKPLTWWQRFAVAFSGLGYAWRTQVSMKVHVVCGAIVIGLGLVKGLQFIEWAILSLTIGFVIGLELVNTAIEAVVDLASPEYAELAKVAKDTASAAVLVASFAAIAVGGCLFFF